MQSLVDKLKALAGAAPVGEAKISLSVPSPGSAEAQPDFSRLHIGTHDPEQHAPLDYVAACRKEARALSRCVLSVTKRLQITEDFAQHFVAIAAKHVRTYSSDGGIPDADRRKDILDTTAIVLGYLIDS